MGTPTIKINQWKIAIREHGKDWEIIKPEEGTYQADPFLWGDLIFFEFYNYEKGVIAYMDIKERKPRVCLEMPYHLSFPFLLEDEGEIYMLPETGRNNCIEIYKAVDFPDKWEKVKVLVTDICAGDSVIYKTDAYYLFTTVGDHKPRVFKADTLLGDYLEIASWEELNSRLAGNIFEKDGKIYKPCQDCLEIYGKRIIIKEITSFPTKSKEIERLDSWTEAIGRHTYNFNDKYEVTDLKYKL